MTRFNDRKQPVEETYFGIDGKMVVSKDGIGASVKYAYSDGGIFVGQSYFDERGALVPVEVRVEKSLPNSLAARIGLFAGDTLVSYAGVALSSIHNS